MTDTTTPQTLLTLDPNEVGVHPNVRHDLGRPADPAHRIPVAHGLAEGRQVGTHAGDLLEAAESVPEAGDDLVEDQDAPPGGSTMTPAIWSGCSS